MSYQLYMFTKQPCRSPALYMFTKQPCRCTFCSACRAVNSVFDSARHYVTIFVRADVPPTTEAKLMEPDKCDGWIWVPYDAIPTPHFLPLEALLKSEFKL